VPERLYAADEFHYLIANRQIASQLGVAMGGEFVSCFNTSAATPVADIDSLTPFRGQVQTPVSTADLQIYYSSSSMHRYVTVFSLAGDTVVNDTVPLDENPGTISFNGLWPTTYYLLRISDDPGFEGESDYMSYFITEDTEMPLMVDRSPGENSWLVGLRDEVAVRFNKLLNTFTIDSSSFYLVGPGGKVAGLYDFGGDTASVVTFTPLADLQPSVEYTAVLTSHIQDNIGNPIDSLSWRFTTGYFDTVGYAGDRLTTDGVTLRFPRGSFASEVEVGVGRIPFGVLSMPAELAFTGLAYDIEAAQSPSREAVLSVLLPDTLRSQPVVIYRYDAGASVWEYVGGTQGDGSLETSVTELGRYGVFLGEPAAVDATDFASSVSLIPRVISPRRGGVNGELQVAYRLSTTSSVVAKVYDTRGQLVTTLMDGESGSVGENLMTWDGRRRDGGYANDGLYVLVIEVDNEIVRKTFVILNK
jgi:hypothetical protein